MDERFKEEAPAELLDEGLSEAEVHALLERLTCQELDAGGGSRVRDVIEATGADPKTIAEMLVDIRKEEFEKRFGLRQEALEERVGEHEERIEDLEARLPPLPPPVIVTGGAQGRTGAVPALLGPIPPPVIVTARREVEPIRLYAPERAEEREWGVSDSSVGGLIVVLSVFALIVTCAVASKGMGHSRQLVHPGNYQRVYEVPGPVVRVPSRWTPQAERVVSPYDKKAIIAANNAFAFSLAKAMRLGYGKTNEMVSPYGVSQELCLVRAGTKGQASKELVSALHIDGLDPENIRSFYRNFDEPENGRALLVGNAVFAQGVDLSPVFLQEGSRFNHATIQTLPKDDRTATQMIDVWSAGETENLVGHFAYLDHPKDGITLANAVAYNGQWSQSFDSALTYTGVFGSWGTRRKVQMMVARMSSLPYSQYAGVQCTRLELEHGLTITLLLPKPGEAPGSVLTSGMYARLTEGLRSGPCEIRLPQFDIDSAIELEPALRSLGVKNLFRRSEGLAPMVSGSRPARVSRVLQRSWISVGAQGHYRSWEPPNYGDRARNWFVADRPFAFVVQGSYDGPIVLMGVVNRP